MIESVNTNKMNTSYMNMKILKIDIKLPSGKPLIYFLVLFLLFHKNAQKSMSQFGIFSLLVFRLWSNYVPVLLQWYPATGHVGISRHWTQSCLLFFAVLSEPSQSMLDRESPI